MIECECECECILLHGVATISAIYNHSNSNNVRLLLISVFIFGALQLPLVRLLFKFYFDSYLVSLQTRRSPTPSKTTLNDDPLMTSL